MNAATTRFPFVGPTRALSSSLKPCRQHSMIAPSANHPCLDQQQLQQVIGVICLPQPIISPSEPNFLAAHLHRWPNPSTTTASPLTVTLMNGMAPLQSRGFCLRILRVHSSLKLINHDIIQYNAPTSLPQCPRLSCKPAKYHHNKNLRASFSVKEQ